VRKESGEAVALGSPRCTVGSHSLPHFAIEEIVSSDQGGGGTSLGEGGFGVVRLGRWRGLPVAFKTLKPAAGCDVDAFWAETAVLGLLRHPNVVQALAMCSRPMCILMELMGGGDLSGKLYKRGARGLSFWEMGGVMLHVAQALCHDRILF